MHPIIEEQLQLTRRHFFSRLGIEVRMGARRFDELQLVEVCAMQAVRQTEVRRTWLHSMPLRWRGTLL